MTDVLDSFVEREYAYGFHSDIDTDFSPKGLNADVVRLISSKNNEPEWLLEWRVGGLGRFLPTEGPPGTL